MAKDTKISINNQRNHRSFFFFFACLVENGRKPPLLFIVCLYSIWEVAGIVFEREITEKETAVWGGNNQLTSNKLKQGIYDIISRIITGNVKVGMRVR